MYAVKPPHSRSLTTYLGKGSDAILGPHHKANMNRLIKMLGQSFAINIVVFLPVLKSYATLP